MKHKIIRHILHMIYPTRCPICGEFIGCCDSFCTNCSDKLNPCNDSYSIDGSEYYCAAYQYDSIVSSAVFMLKNGTCGNAAYALGNALADKLESEGIANIPDLIIPVPVHRSTKIKRGYNQSALIARQVGKRLNLKVHCNAVVKHRLTASQKSLSKADRLTNLKGAFSVRRPDIISGHNILLIDDICTTGSTLSEIAQLLKSNGAASVCCASCCKTPEPKINGGTTKNEY